MRHDVTDGTSEMTKAVYAMREFSDRLREFSAAVEALRNQRGKGCHILIIGGNWVIKPEIGTGLVGRIDCDLVGSTQRPSPV